MRDVFRCFKFTVFAPLLIYEVVAEEQEGEDTTGDCDDDEWERGMCLEVTTCKLARLTHNPSQLP